MNQEINTWRNREGRINETAWLSQGIGIFRRLLKDDHNKAEYKTTLAKLLIRSGTDEKLKHFNLMEAKQLFEEVIDLFPNDSEALYRLGHISYENGEYQRSIDYFSKAMALPLSEIRSIRSLLTISKAYYQLGDEGEAYFALQKAVEKDKERNFTGEIDEARRLITMDGRNKRLERYEDGVHQFISDMEAERLQGETLSNSKAQLDLTHLRSTFTGSKDTERLPRRETEILSYLIENKSRYIPKEELYYHIWEDDNAPSDSTLKSYISQIRKKVRKCVCEDNGEIIDSKRGLGYKWVCPIEVNIVKSI